MGDLREDSHAVAHLSGGVLAGAVFQLLHDVQSVIHHTSVLTPVNIHDTADAAGIMFHLRVHFLFSPIPALPRRSDWLSPEAASELPLLSRNP